MPGKAEDKRFGPSRHSSTKALAGMIRTYGLAEGHRVYQATLQDRTAAGKTYGGRDSSRRV